jgi:FkbM family methyltransferase
VRLLADNCQLTGLEKPLFVHSLGGASLRHRLRLTRFAQRHGGLAKRLNIARRDDLIQLGTPNYGFWVIPSSALGPESTCYLAGVGTDISFDLALIERFGCTVYAFDPVPAAAEFVIDAASSEPRFIFSPVGLWSADTTLPFHGPATQGWISHSATDIHRTEVLFEAPVRSIRSLMSELGHERLDLLKLSVEGSEYEILESLDRDGVLPRILCVEFAQPAPKGAPEAAYDKLIQQGYATIASSLRNRSVKLTFVHRDTP